MENCENKKKGISKKSVEQIQKSVGEHQDILNLEELEKTEGGACGLSCLLMLSTASSNESLKDSSEAEQMPI